MTPATATLVVVQARTGSTRLPGKVLAELDGQPMLAFQLRRLQALADARVVVATSDRDNDDAVADVAAGLGVEVVRGSEADVLARFVLALDRHPAETVVRLTGDCPLTDPALVSQAVDLHLRSSADYTSNVLPRSFPKGLDVEVMSAAALRLAHAEAVDAGDREHVTPYLYRRPGRFRLANLDSGCDLGNEWWTVDTAEDLDSLRDMVAHLDDPTTASWREVLATVGRRHGPEPGRVHLRVLGPPAPGSDPWCRSWSAEVDGEPVGRLDVYVGSTVDDEQAFRWTDLDPRWRDDAEAACQRLLSGDQQTRA